MKKTQGNYKIQQPKQRRSIFQNLIYDRTAYSKEEIRLRDKILTLRDASQIDRALLKNDISWFSDDIEVAFDIQNKDSWFLDTMYRPRAEIVPSSFMVGVLNQKVSWHRLSVLQRRVSDFLYERCANHSDEFLNEPIHFFYLDLMQILEQLSLSSDPEYVGTQLPRISQYILQVSSLIPTDNAADNLFLEDFRVNLNDILEKDVARQLDSSQLNNILSQTQSALEKLGEQYHSILHYSFMSQRVNVNPYWEYFQIGTSPDDSHVFPTSIGQNCLRGSDIQLAGDRTSYSVAIPDCPELPIHPDLTVEQQTLYLRNIQQLQELIHFKQILMEVQKLVTQTGEIFTMMMFRKDLMNLFAEIDQFFIKSHESMINLIDENDHLYRESIQLRNSLTWYQDLWGTKQQLLDNYIINQKKLASFSITKQSLYDSRRRVTDLLLKATSQLNAIDATGQDKLLDAEHAAHKLIGAIYDWRLHQHHRIGLPLPPKPQLLGITDGTATQSADLASEDVKDEASLAEKKQQTEMQAQITNKQQHNKCDSIFFGDLIEDTPQKTDNNQYEDTPLCWPNTNDDEDFSCYSDLPETTLFTQRNDLASTLPLSATNTACFFPPPSNYKMISSGNTNVNLPSTTNNAFSSSQLMLLGALIPGALLLVLVAVLWIYKRKQSTMNDESESDEEEVQASPELH